MVKFTLRTFSDDDGKKIQDIFNTANCHRTDRRRSRPVSTTGPASACLLLSPLSHPSHSPASTGHGEGTYPRCYRRPPQPLPLARCQCLVQGPGRCSATLPVPVLVVVFGIDLAALLTSNRHRRRWRTAYASEQRCRKRGHPSERPVAKMSVVESVFAG